MDKAIAMLEYATIASGMLAADAASKAARIEFITMRTVSPGKFIALFCGGLGAIREALHHAETRYPEGFMDSFLLGSPHAQVLPAFKGSADMQAAEALGVLESGTVSSVIVAADAAAKSASVHIARIRIEENLCGKSYMLITGGVAEVTEAMAHARKAAGENRIIDTAVLTGPSMEFWASLRGN